MKSSLKRPLCLLLGAAAVFCLALAMISRDPRPDHPNPIPNLVEKTGEHFTKGAIKAIKDELTPTNNAEK